jgi:hypothetical protein
MTCNNLRRLKEKGVFRTLRNPGRMSEYQGPYLRLGRVLQAYSEQKGIAPVNERASTVKAFTVNT